MWRIITMNLKTELRTIFSIFVALIFILPQLNKSAPTAVLLIAAIFGVILIFTSIKKFVIAAMAGIMVVFLANAIAGFGISYSWMVMLISIVGGIPGAIVIIVLHILEITF